MPFARAASSIRRILSFSATCSPLDRIPLALRYGYKNILIERWRVREVQSLSAYFPSFFISLWQLFISALDCFFHHSTPLIKAQRGYRDAELLEWLRDIHSLP